MKHPFTVRSFLRFVVCLFTLTALLTSCVRVTEPDRTKWEEVPTDVVQSNPQPPPNPILPKGPAPTGPCIDPDAAVIATCLDSTSDVVSLDGVKDIVVSERRTGKIIEFIDRKPKGVFAQFSVNSAGNSGLLDFTLSPHYIEDHLVFALAQTSQGIEVLRIAPKDHQKSIVATIPSGPGNNSGSLLFTSDDTLVVATSSGGNTASANDPHSLAGKLFSIHEPASDGSSRIEILAQGLGEDPSLCLSDKDNSLWLTERSKESDKLLHLKPESHLLSQVWDWIDSPGVSGCAISQGSIYITEEKTQKVERISLAKDTDAVREKPVTVIEKKYGKLGRTQVSTDGDILITTVNKEDQGPQTKTDDRVFVLPAGGGLQSQT